MTLNDVLTLARAGFTAQQISALAAGPAPAPAAADAAPAPAAAGPAPAPAAADPAPAPAAADPAPAPAADPIAALTGKLDALTAAIQANGLANAKQPPQQTPDDIIASIIAPPIPDGTKQ